MPVYEVVLQHSNGSHRVRHCDVPAEIGDALTLPQSRSPLQMNQSFSEFNLPSRVSGNDGTSRAY